MIQRCTNFNREDFQTIYKDVDIDPRWFDFITFLSDMGERPDLDHSLGRINPTKGYEKSNCEWQTIKQQVACRWDRTMTINGMTRTFGEWADHCGIKRKSLIKRIERGWGDDAFTRKRS